MSEPTVIEIDLSVVPEDGVPQTLQATYHREGPEGPKSYYREIIKSASGLFPDVASTMAYSGFANDAAFIEHLRLKLVKEAESRMRARAKQRAIDAVMEEFESSVEPLYREALKGLNNEDLIIAACRSAIEYGGWVPQPGLAIAPMGLKHIRGKLREAYSQGRTTCREEYPDDYAEADDKDDFYSDHEDDVAHYFADFVKGEL